MIDMVDVIYDVDVASDVKDFLLSNAGDVTFDKPQLKTDILGANNDTLIRVGRVIDSPTMIVSVDVVDAAFLESNLFK